MNRFFPICLMCLVLGTVSASATAFDDANQRFKSGDFIGAATAYEKILTTEGPRAAAYYNLGNSYQNLKQYGPAILAYERARLLTPRDPDLLANLALARKAATAFDETGMNSKLEAVLDYLSRDEWSWLVAGSALFLGALALVSGILRVADKLRVFAMISAGAAVLAIIAGSTALYLRRSESGKGIVLSENATVRLSPFEKAESLGTPGPGKAVHLGAKNGGFQYVEVAGAGLHGWLADKDVASIVPE